MQTPTPVGFFCVLIRNWQSSAVLFMLWVALHSPAFSMTTANAIHDIPLTVAQRSRGVRLGCGQHHPRGPLGVPESAENVQNSPKVEAHGDDERSGRKATLPKLTTVASTSSCQVNDFSRFLPFFMGTIACDHHTARFSACQGQTPYPHSENCASLYLSGTELRIQLPAKQEWCRAAQ